MLRKITTRHPLSIGEKGQRSYYSLARVRAYILLGVSGFFAPSTGVPPSFPGSKKVDGGKGRIGLVGKQRIGVAAMGSSMDRGLSADKR